MRKADFFRMSGGECKSYIKSNDRVKLFLVFLLPKSKLLISKLLKSKLLDSKLSINRFLTDKLVQSRFFYTI